MTGTGRARLAMVAGGAMLAVVAWVESAGMRAPDRPVPRPVVRAKPSAAVAAAKPVAARGMVIRRVLDVPHPFTHGDYVWDEAGVPPGPMIVTVDLIAQTLSVFRGGYEIGTAVILYGADAKPTPLGIFPITQKDAHHVSSLYDAPMPYMLRLTGDGVSIHGSDVRYGYASHGCIGVPTPFAAKLFRAVQVGDRVIVTRGEMLQAGGAITAA